MKPLGKVSTLPRNYCSLLQVLLLAKYLSRFQDGTPFNADAVVFNINRILTTTSSPRYSEMSSVQSVEAIDSSHVRFNLKHSFSPLLATLTDRSGMMLSPAVVQKLGGTVGNGPTNAGTGPFMFSDWVKGALPQIKCACLLANLFHCAKVFLRRLTASA